jgi:hypothetical protein
MVSKVQLVEQVAVVKLVSKEQLEILVRKDGKVQLVPRVILVSKV